MLVTLPLLYTLSTSIKVNANKLIQVSVHALTDYPFFLLIALGIMLCRYLSNNVVRSSDKFSFIFIFFPIIIISLFVYKNKHVPIIIIVELHNIYLLGELMCGTTTMNARNILKRVRELSLAFT